MNITYEIQLFRYMSDMLINISNLILHNTPTSKFKNIYYQVAKWYIYNVGSNCTNETHPLILLQSNNKISYKQLYKDIYNTTQIQLNDNLKNKINDIIINTNITIKQLNKLKYSQKYTIKLQNDYMYYYSDFKKYKIELNKTLYDKLKKTYTGSNNKFNEYVFILLLRYTLFGSKKETICLSVDFVYNNPKITNKIKLEIELFGNPVNRNLSKFCSLYPDIEQYWGSIGSFFCLEDTIWSKYKYFVANPPYDEYIMEQMAIKICSILSQFDECCFIITIPDWLPTNSS